MASENYSGCRVRIIVPDDWADSTIRRVVNRWGGCTSYKATGYWDDGKGQVHADHMTVVETSIDVPYDAARGSWERLAEFVRAAADEDCVYLSAQPEAAFLVYDGRTERIG